MSLFLLLQIMGSDGWKKSIVPVACISEVSSFDFSKDRCEKDLRACSSFIWTGPLLPHDCLLWQVLAWDISILTVARMVCDARKWEHGYAAWFRSPFFGFHVYVCVSMWKSTYENLPLCCCSGWTVTSGLLDTSWPSSPPHITWSNWEWVQKTQSTSTDRFPTFVLNLLWFSVA